MQRSIKNFPPVNSELFRAVNQQKIQFLLSIISLSKTLTEISLDLINF